MSKHTPGPWKIFDNRLDREFQDWDVARMGVRPENSPGDIAHVWMNQHRGEETVLANAKLIAAAPEMFAILDELEGAFDKEIYPEQKKEDFDALDDREYTVTITAKQWRALGRALGKAQGAA